MVPVKTRAELYGHEATELLRIISMYPGLSEKQLCRFYPGREDVTRNLLSHLCRQGRTRQADTGGYFPYGNGKAVHWSTKIGHFNCIFLHTICDYCPDAYVSLYCFGVKYPSEYAGRSSLKNFI